MRRTACGHGSLVQTFTPRFWPSTQRPIPHSYARARASASPPHPRRAEASCRLSTTVAPLRLRKRAGQPCQGWVSGFHLEVPVTFSQVGTRPSPACDSVTWGQDRYNRCSVVIAGPWQMDFPSCQGPRIPSSGCRSSTAEKTSAASASRSRTADGSPPTNGNELHFGRIAEMKPETSVEEGDETAPTELERFVSGPVNAVAVGTARTAAPHDPAHVELGPLRLFPGFGVWITTRLVHALPLPPSSASRTATNLVNRSLIQWRRMTSGCRGVVLALTEEGWALTQHLKRRVQANESMLADGVTGQEIAVFSSIYTRGTTNHASLLQSNLRESPGPVHLKYSRRREDEKRQAHRWSGCRCVGESYRGPVEGPGGDS